MGFAVEPMERDEPSVAFVMPLGRTTGTAVSRGSAGERTRAVNAPANRRMNCGD